MTNISEMKNAAIKIARHDGGCDTWKLGEDCAIQMWHVTDDPVIETRIAGE